MNLEYAYAYHGRGSVYKELKRVPEAIADLERYLELSIDPHWTKEAQKQLEKLRGQ